jgi:hypothetical protein
MTQVSKIIFETLQVTETRLSVRRLQEMIYALQHWQPSTTGRR